jgi:hypothetical protein
MLPAFRLQSVGFNATPTKGGRIAALANKSKLATVYEESPCYSASASNRFGAVKAVTLSTSSGNRALEDMDVEEGDESSDLDSDLEGWDDETTLVAKFHETFIGFFNSLTTTTFTDMSSHQRTRS